MNNDNNRNNKTRAFSKPNTTAKSNDSLKLDTNMNIRRAVAKKTLKNGSKVTGICLKKGFQWALNIFLTLLLMCTICGVIVGGTFALYVKNYLIDNDYDIPDLKTNLDMTTKIFTANENGVFYELEDESIHGTENRSWVSYQRMPKNLYNAFVAIEDERFWKHNGVDWKRTIGAVLEFVTGNDSYGGSTITQQLIKNVSKNEETTIQRKVTEIFRALSLSEKRSKEEVIEMYLNTINLSRGNYGVQAAANYYFGKDVSDLTLVECAALASIPKSPTKFDPLRNPDNNKERRNAVLKKMKELGWISEEECTAAQNTELVLNITLDDANEAADQPYSYFKDALIEEIVKDLYDQYGYSRKVALNLIYSGGLQIYTTMDPEIQNAMEEVFEDENSFQKVSDGIQPESAMVVMDPYTGDVLGIVGGRGEKKDKLGYNRATQSKRQVGSSIKPLTVYAPAMDLGLISYGTVVDDTPFTYMEDQGRYWPSNSPARYNGKITINEAIMVSKNTTAAKIIDKMTPSYAFNFAKKKLHLDSMVPADEAIAPLALGGFTHGLTVLEMTAAYSIFPNGGAYSYPRLYTKVLNSDGTVLLEKKIKQEPVISQGTSTVMTKILQNVVSGGTAAGITLDQKINLAGKTGSTNDNKDLYFAGFSPYYVGACWFGYDVPKNLNNFVPNPAMLAWEKVMTKIHQKHFDSAANGTAPLNTFDYSKMKAVSICLDSGLLPSDECYKDVRTVMNGTSRIGTEYYYEGSKAPTQTCNVHVSVDWDKSENCLANEYCPEEDVIKVSLIKETSRAFTHGNVAVLDAIYTYRPVPKNAVYPIGAPFYQYTLPKDTYAGYAVAEEGKPVNKMCDKHTKPEEPEIPEHILPIPDDDEQIDDENQDGNTENTENTEDTENTENTDITENQDEGGQQNTDDDTTNSDEN